MKIILILFTLFLSSLILVKQYEYKPTVSGVSTEKIATPTLIPLSISKILENNYHIFQTFNNCGPAALSMTLSYYGIDKNQEELGQSLRPYQINGGLNDDKSVNLDELANKSSEYNLVPFHRPNGTIELIKQFISYDIPIITRSRLSEDEDIGHYRVVKGYDDATGEIIQDDSLQGPNLRYSYQQFLNLWQVFNYEYLVLVPFDQVEIARIIMRENSDLITAWKNAVVNSQKELDSNPENIYSRFNLSVALYHAGDFKRSVSEFESVENNLPFRTLWYQIEPIQAYYELGNFQKVFDITEKIFNDQNAAFSEMYIIRGEIYKKQGNTEAAKKELEKAVFYNVNLRSAQEMLLSLSR